MMTPSSLTAVDLFCGCGGISVGISAAGFKVLAGIDIEPTYLASFSHNFPHARSLQDDISVLPPDIFMARLGLAPGQLGLLVGGPPCQGFSKNVPRKNRYLDDPKNHLVKSFLDYCETLQPQLVLMENVAEMKNGFDQSYTEEILSRLNSSGYAVSHAVLNAADYGVPQRRRRAFFIANRSGIRLDFPMPTHVKPGTAQGLFTLREQVSVWEAIGDLPSLQHGEGNKLTEYSCPPFSDFQRFSRNGNKAVTNHVARQLQPTQLSRLASLQPGQGLKDLPADLQTKGGYSGAYGRLTKEMIAPTITRWVFHPGSGRWGHPVDTRLLTIREIARIQGFPDDFEFVGSYVQMAGQLGNAVPPLLAQKIMETVLTQLQTSSAARSFMNLSRSTLSSGNGHLNVTT